MRAWMRSVYVAVAVLVVFALVAPGSALTAAPTRTPTASGRTPTATPEPEAVDEELPVTPEQPASESPSALELTVYNQSLGLVRETRQTELAQGQNEVSLQDIPSRIIPASVHITPLAGMEEVSLLEQRFDYDVVDSTSLLKRYIDQTITLTTPNGESVTGQLISAAEDVVLLTDWGIEVIRQSQIQQISLPTLAQKLVTRPTLTWLLDSPKSGPVQFRVTYLTGGVTWQADYVALLDEQDTAMDLQSWISVSNESGADYQDAKLKLVAGSVHQVEEMRMAEAEGAYKVMDTAAAAPAVEERSFMDYHLYDVARPVTLLNNQTKQLEFLRADEVSVLKQYVFEVTPPIWVGLGSAVTDSSYGVSDQRNVEVQLEIENDEASGLGMPLPEGTVRIYKEDVDGSATLVGEDRISHTPRNETVHLSLGSAFDLVGERVQTAFRQLGERSLEETIEITLRNQSEDEVTIQVFEHLYRAHDAEVTESSMDYEQIDANTIRYAVEVGPEDSATLSYTVVYRW